MNAGKETTLSFHSLDKGDYYVVTMRAASEGREFDSEIRLWSNTDLPAHSDTVYSDTPLTVTLLAHPK